MRQIRELVKFIRNKLTYSNSNEAWKRYIANPDEFFKSIWKGKEADCFVANTLAVRVISEIDKNVNFVGGYFVKEKNKEVFGANKKYVNDDTERLIAVYCTNPRIDKMIFYLRTEGVMELNLIMMTKLPMLVLEDIIEENYKEIIISNYTIDFRKFRGLIAKRCLAVLKQVMVNSQLNENGL